MWDKVFKNETSEICGRQPLKILLAPFVNTLSRVDLLGMPIDNHF